YPLQRRPGSVVANILLDARKRVWKANPFIASQAELDAEDLTADDGFAGSAMLREAAELGLISERTQRVLSVVYLDGLPSAQAAEHTGLSAGAVRFRCSRALRLLRHNAHLFEA
ncbi:MAG: hypothetical protein LBK28_04460, partial [Propionibacteriaceae bacterium]|nr:hypothetical protein [Propionibacteriaceae bacterium]